MLIATYLWLAQIDAIEVGAVLMISQPKYVFTIKQKMSLPDNKSNWFKNITKHVSYDCKCIFRGRKGNSNQKQNNYFCQCLCKHPIKHRFLINSYV